MASRNPSLDKPAAPHPLAPEAQLRHQQSKLNDRAGIVLAFIVTLGFFTVLYFIIFNDVKNRDVVQTLLGVLETGWAGIMSYYYGSSVGSKEKNSILAEKAQPTSIAAAGRRK